MFNIFFIVRKLNKTLLFFALINFLWVILYKFFFIKKEACCYLMSTIGEIYYPISLSIFSAYIIYLITSEIRTIKISKTLSPILFSVYLDVGGIADRYLYLLGFRQRIDDFNFSNYNGFIDEIHKAVDLYISSYSILDPDIQKSLSKVIRNYKRDIENVLDVLRPYNSFLSDEIIRAQIKISQLNDSTTIEDADTVDYLKFESLFFISNIYHFRSALKKEFVIYSKDNK